MLTKSSPAVKFPARLVALILSCCLLAPVGAVAKLPSALSDGDVCRFAIFREGDRVGSHVIKARTEGDLTTIHTEIEIRVTFAFLTLYDYSHRATETWRDGKLLRLRAVTDNDGTPEFVDLDAGDDGFSGTSTAGALKLPPSVGFTSYWNPDYLGQSRWLDTQDGSILSMSVEALGAESVDLRGARVPAERYRATAADGALVEFWYAEGELARMRFRAFDGSILDYIRE